MNSNPPFSILARSFPGGPRPRNAALILAGLWLGLFFAALFAPPLLDDADATHAQAARAMATTGDLVTLKVNGIRYLEKAPLPYWLVAVLFKVFGFNAFAVHLPSAVGVALLALLGHRWANQAFGSRTAFYTAVAVLTSTGVFLFTRIFIPEVLLSLFLATTLFAFLKSLRPPPAKGFHAPVQGPPHRALPSRNVRPSAQPHKLPPFARAVETVRSLLFDQPTTKSRPPYSAEATTPERPAVTSWYAGPYFYPAILWSSLALAVLTKGLVALVFFFGTATLYLALTGEYRLWRSLKPLSGIVLFFAIAAPWHILAGIRNTGSTDGHGFFWFYFINEHVLRFLGRRIPRDYNKLPSYLFWSLHLIWLFPWSLFLPLGAVAARAEWHRWRARTPIPPRLAASARITGSFTARSTLLLALFALLILLFFSLSTNQEYYTFPAYLPILLLTCAALTRAEQSYASDSRSRRWIRFAHATLSLLGAIFACCLAYGLWTSRHYPFVADIGTLLARRGVGDYTLSMSHFFDLTGSSFAALRFPAVLALIAFAVGPAVAWTLRMQRRHIAATTAVALTSGLFLVAAHLALIRFAPMLSSADMAATIQRLRANHAIARTTKILLIGEPSDGSSIPFYLGERVFLVDGRTSSLIFGSHFVDAPDIFLTGADLLRVWGSGDRKLLFVPAEKREDVARLLGSRQVLVQETSGKALITDRPLDR